MKKVVAGIFAFLFVLSLAVALDLRSSTPIAFSKGTTIVINSTHPNPFRFSSVQMSFSDLRDNTFSVILVRNANAYTLFSYTGSYTNISWLPGPGLNFKLNDQIIFTNTSPATATLTYNYEL